MPADNDLFFGRIAVELEFCTRAQVQRCLDIQSRAERPMPLGRHLVDEGILTEEQHSRVLQVQRRLALRMNPLAGRPREDLLFGRLAVREGLVSENDLSECLRALAQPGEKCTLGEIMVKRGLLTSDQVKVLLGRQSKSIMSCPACRLSFTVATISKGKTIHCPRCKGPLQPGKSTDSVRTDGEVASDSVRMRLEEVAPEPPARAPSPERSCKICDHPFVTPVTSDGRVECLSCHVRFVP